MTTEDELQSSLILSSFLEIITADTVQIARHFLDVTNWNLDEAIQLFFAIESEVSSSSDDDDSSDDDSSLDDIDPPLMEENHQSNSSCCLDDEGQVSTQLPLPVRREYDDGYNEMEEEMVLALDASKKESDSLGWMYPPPTHLTYKGTFEKAKQVASMEEKWLLVNLQSKKDLSSHMLNRDTWSNEGVAQILNSNFIFWQVSDDTIEGVKFSTYYNLIGSTPPVVLLLDPITGQQIYSWNGMTKAKRLMEELVPFMDAGIKGKQPHPHHKHQQQQLPRQSTDLQRTIVNQQEEDKELMLAIALSMENTLTNGDPVCPSTSINTEMDEESPSLSEEEDTCLMQDEKNRIDNIQHCLKNQRQLIENLFAELGFGFLKIGIEATDVSFVPIRYSCFGHSLPLSFD